MRARTREAPLLLFLAAYAAELVAFGSIGLVLLIATCSRMVPVAAILAVARHGPADPAFGRSHAFVHAALAWLATSALIIAANSFAYDAARWRAGEAAVAMGYDARTVDAGYEWVGVSRRATVGKPGSDIYGLAWYDDELALVPPCAVRLEQPVEASRVTGSYSRMVGLSPVPVLRPGAAALPVRLAAAGCPEPPSPDSASDGWTRYRSQGASHGMSGRRSERLPSAGVAL